MTYQISEREPFVQIVSVDNLLHELENREILNAAVSSMQNGFNRCILDLSNLSTMNSVGLNFLINLRSRSLNAGGDFVLVNPNDQVIKLLEITKLKSFFKLNHTIEEAEGLLTTV